MEYVLWSMYYGHDTEYEQYMNSHINELSDVNNLDAHLKVTSHFISHDIT